MAAVASSEDTVLGDPNFAVVCSFLQKFGDLCGAADFSVDFLHLQRILEDTRSVHVDLIDLHVRLLRKLGRKNITHEKWELSLVKYCHGYSKVDAWEIERFGYKKSKLSVKINLLKRLLESQFDRNGKLKSEVNKLSAEQLRTLPIGKDVRGQLYWFQVDDDLNLRVYREDQDEETFELVVRERDDLITLIENLVTNTNLGTKKEEDSTTPSDTGDSKDGEASLDKQDVKVSEENLHFCVKAAEVEEDALSGFPKIAADLQIKREPKDLLEDLKPNEFVANEIKDESPPKEEVMDVGEILAASCAPASVLETKDTDLKSNVPSTATETCAAPAAEDLSKSGVIEKSDYSKFASVLVLPARMSVIKMANAGVCGNQPQDNASSKKDASSAAETAACISKGFSDDGAISTANASAPAVITEAVGSSAAPTPPVDLRTDEEVAPRIEKAAERRTMPFKKRGIPKNLKTSDDKTVADAPTKEVENPVEPSIVAAAACLPSDKNLEDFVVTKMTVDKKTDELLVGMKIDELLVDKNNSVDKKTDNLSFDKKTDNLSVDKEMAEDVVLKQPQASSSPSPSVLDAEKESAAEIMEDMMKRIEIKVLSDNASTTKEEIACVAVSLSTAAAAGDRVDQDKTEKLDGGDSSKGVPAAENVVTGRLCQSGHFSKAAIATSEREIVKPTELSPRDDAETWKAPTGDRVLTLKSVSDEQQVDATLNVASEAERTNEMLAVKTADVSVEPVDNEKCEKRAKDGAVLETTDVKMSETKYVKMSKTKVSKMSETKVAKISERKDVNISESKDAKILETKDAKLSEAKDVKMSETKVGKISKTKVGKMSETKDVKMSGTKDAKMSEAKDVKISETKDAKISEAKGVKMSEAKDVKISEAKDVKISETKDTKMSETEDAKMSETKDVKLSEAEDAKMSETKDAKISESKDVKVSESKDVKMSETRDVLIRDATNSLTADTKDASISEPKDVVKVDESESAEVTSKETQVANEKVGEKSPLPTKECSEVLAEAKEKEDPPERPRGRGRRPKARGPIAKSAVSVPPVDVPAVPAFTEKTVDGDGQKTEAGEGEPVVPPPTAKKPRGRRRRTTAIIAEAAAEPNDHMERPERIQPKRSCRLEAQRVKQVEDERRIEEALQREAMLVQHRLHEERKRKELQAGAAATTAMTTTTGGTSSVLSLTDVVGTKPSNGQVKQAGRRRKNAKVTASSVNEDAKAALKKERKKTGPGRGKRKKLTQAPPPPPPQQLAATNGSNGRSKKRKAGYNPWDCSSESSAASSCVEEDEEYGMEEPEESDEELVFNEGSDHEFSPESESDNGDDVWQPAKLKRARTVRRVKSDNEEGSTDESDDDKPCSKCDKYDHPEWILLCDKCDNGFHASCLRPPLMLIPDGDWFCPSCDHKMLVEKLQEQLKNLDQLWKKKEREEMRKKRLAYVGISLDNVLKPEKRETEDEEHDDDDGGGDGGADDDVGDYLLLRKRSRRARKEVSYRFKEFDELIDSAIQDETSLGVALLAVPPPPPSLLLSAPPPSSAIATSRPNAVVETGAPEVLMSGWSSRLTQQWVRVQQEHGFRFGGDGLLQETPLRANFGKGKDLATIIASEKAETEETKVESVMQKEEVGKKKVVNEEEGDDDDDGEDELVVVRKTKKKHRRLNDLDSPSDDDDSDEDFKGSGSESEHPSEDESGAGAEETDDSWKDNHGGRGRSQRSGGGRRRRSDDDFVVDDSDESLDAPRTVRRAAAKSVNYRELSDSDDGRNGNKKKLDYHSTGRRPARIESDESSSSEDSDWKKKKKKTSGTAGGSGSSKKSHRSQFSAFAMINRRKLRTIDSDDDDDDDDGRGRGGGPGCSSRSRRRIRTKSAKSYEEVSDDSEDARPKDKKKARLDVKDFELDSNERSEDSSEEEDDDEDDDDDADEEEDEGDAGVEVKSKRKRVVCVGDSDDEPTATSDPAKAGENVAKDTAVTKTFVDDAAAAAAAAAAVDAKPAVAVAERSDVDDRVTLAAAAEPPLPPPSFSSKDPNKYSVIKSVESVKKELLKQTKCAPIRSSHSRPFPSSQQHSSPHVDAIATVQVLSSREEGSLQKLESLAKGPDDGAPSYQDRLRAPDYQSRPSPLKPSVMEAAAYPIRSSPSKLMLLDTAYTTSSKLTTLEPYNAASASAAAATSSPSLSGGLQPYDRPSRLQGPPPQFHPPPEYGGYPPGQYYPPPPNYPPQPPGAHQYGYQPPPPPNPYPQYHHHHHSQQQQQQQHHAMNYNYMPQGYGGEQGPYSQGPPPQYGGGGPGPYGNYSSPPPPSPHPPPAAAHQQPPLQHPPPPSSLSSSQQQPPGPGSASAVQQATSLPNQPNGRFSIENLLQRRIEGAAAGEDDEFSTVNDLVSYITGSSSHDTQL